MELETATTAATQQGAVKVLAAVFVLVVAASATVMVVAMCQRQYRTRFVSGQILVVSLSLPALWLARYDSSGLPRVATILGVVGTAAMVLKYRSKKCKETCKAIEQDEKVGQFTEQISAFNDGRMRPHWLPEKPIH